MKKVYIILAVFISCECLAQQEIQLTQYMFNKQYFNPASVGNQNMISTKILARKQWIGFKDEAGNNVSPQTYMLSIDAPIFPLHSGFGAIIYQDKLGYESNIGIRFSYAYKINLGTKNILCIGAGVTLLNRSMDFSKFVAKHPDDPSLNGQGRQYCYITDFSAGIYYQALKKLYFSLSASQLRQAEGEMGQSSFKLIRQYYFSGGYAFQINKSNKGAPITLEPSFQIASDGVDFQFDVTGLVNFNDQFYGGVGYRFQDAVCLLVGLNYKDFNVGLSYDITTSKINKLGSYGSPEIMVGYNYKLTPPVEKRNYFNARFL